MAQWRPFEASNQLDTCLWCGRKLRYKTSTIWPVGESWPMGTIRAELSGDYEDGFFCGLRCAYQFGAAAAHNGYRLRLRSGEGPGARSTAG